MQQNPSNQNCPRCMSASTSPLNLGRHKCNACGNKFFSGLQPGSSSPMNQFQGAGGAKKSQWGWLGVVIFWFVFMGGLPAIIFGVIDFIDSSSDFEVNYYSQDSVEEQADDWSSVQTWFFEDDQGLPILLVVGAKNRYDPGRENLITIAFFDAQTGKELASQDIPTADSWFSDVEFRTFGSGEVYLIMDESKLYQIDQVNKKAMEVPDSFYQNQPDLSPGIAKIEFVYDDEGDGLSIMTNVGKQVYFYPGIDQVFSQDQRQTADKGFDTIPPDTPVQTTFVFTRDSTDFPDEITQLLKVEHKNLPAYPQWGLIFFWSKDYGRSGFFTDADPYSKVLINDWQRNSGRVVSFVDFTPERLYFDPEVLLVTSEMVLISFDATPAESASASVQALDANTAEVLWTLDVDDWRIQSGFAYEDGFFLKTYSGGLLVSGEGEVLEEYDF